MGLTMTYAGSNRQDIVEIISPLILDQNNDMEVIAVAAIALGLINIGSKDEICLEALMTVLMTRDKNDLNSPYASYIALALGLLFFGQQDDTQAILMVVSSIDHPIRKYIEVLVTGCAYACTGNVLEIQKMLHLVSEHVDPIVGDENQNHYQTAAVISIGLIAFGEDIGTQMC